MSSRLKAGRVVDEITSAGRAFQTRGAMTGKARVRPCKTFISPSTMQNLIAVCHILCGCCRKFGSSGTRPLGWGKANPLETHLFSTCVASPNLVALYGHLRRSAKKLDFPLSFFKVTQGHCNRHISIGYGRLIVSGH